MDGDRKDVKFGYNFLNPWKEGAAHDITFVVTEDCNLRCKYCYISGKASEKVMSIETAKKAVDYLLDNPEMFNSEAVVWNFIGGEPTLETDLIDQICDYIKTETYRRNHKWGNCYRFNICTNGILYGTDKFQKLMKKNKSNMSVGITIDGTKEKHDLQRVYPDGSGSYDDVIKNVELWKKQFGNPVTKVTIGHADLPYLAESIIHLWNIGLETIPANVVYEDAWEDGDDILFEQQLIKLADYVLDNKLWNTYSCTLFTEHIGYPLTKDDKKKNHCGTGKMLAIDYRGNLYPCVRFMQYSLNRQNEFSVGNIYEGIDLDKVRTFYGLDASVQSTDECLNCEVAVGCGWCQGNNYDSADSDTMFQRSTYICKMHKARVRAVNYYWEKLKERASIERQWMPKKKHLYFILADNSVEHCNYSNKKTDKFMSTEVLNKGLEFTDKNFYRPVLLHSNSKGPIDYNKLTKYKDKIDIYPIEKELEMDNVLGYPVYSSQNIQKVSEKSICVLNVEENEVDILDKMVIQLLTRFQRININLKVSNNSFPLDVYREKLKNISNVLLQYYQRGIFKEINKITDVLLLDEMENCDFGVNNYALAPNGKIYICPAFYYDNPDNYICSIGEEIGFKNSHLLNIKHSKFCGQCNIYSCNRCIYDNKKKTREYSVPGSLQCKVSAIEYRTSYDFINGVEESKIQTPQFRKIKELEHDDIIEKIQKEAFSPVNMCY